jgi:hypothetical protein
MRRDTALNPPEAGATAGGGGLVFYKHLRLTCGLALVSTMALIVAPVFHRFLHKFHLPDDK